MKYIYQEEDLASLFQNPETIFVDVRSPREYAEATIPGAINIPVLRDDETVQVAIAYHQESVQAAKRLGLEFVSARLPEMYQQYDALNDQHYEIVIFCRRGGMRSDSIYNLLRSLRLHVKKIDGGYKTYRRFIRNALPSIVEQHAFITLYGMTGTGKTDILQELQALGANVLDLEGLANHKGSRLGSVGQGDQPSQKQFESLLYHQLAQFGPGPVFTEGESPRIGSLIVPPFIREAMRQGKMIEITATTQARVTRLQRDYGDYIPQIQATIAQMESFIGKQPLSQLQAMIDAGEIATAIQFLMERYYDRVYRRSELTMAASYQNDQPEETARQIYQAFVAK